MYEFRLRFHWGLFLRIRLTIFQFLFSQWLGTDQATSHCLNKWWLVYWHMYASLGLSELVSELWDVLWVQSRIYVQPLAHWTVFTFQQNVNGVHCMRTHYYLVGWGVVYLEVLPLLSSTQSFVNMFWLTHWHLEKILLKCFLEDLIDNKSTLAEVGLMSSVNVDRSTMFYDAIWPHWINI